MKDAPLKVSTDWILTVEIKKGNTVIESYTNSKQSYMMTFDNNHKVVKREGPWLGDYTYSYLEHGTYTVTTKSCGSNVAIKKLVNSGGGTTGYTKTFTPKTSQVKVSKCTVIVK